MGNGEWHSFTKNIKSISVKYRWHVAIIKNKLYSKLQVAEIVTEDHWSPLSAPVLIINMFSVLTDKSLRNDRVDRLEWSIQKFYEIFKSKIFTCFLPFHKFPMSATNLMYASFRRNSWVLGGRNILKSKSVEYNIYDFSWHFLYLIELIPIIRFAKKNLPHKTRIAEVHPTEKESIRYDSN